MNKEVYVNIKISMPNGSDMSFSDEEIKEIQDYYEKEFSNFDYLVGEINVSFVDEKTKQIDQLKQQLVEKDKEIKKLNWQLKDKDFIIKNLNHSLSVAPNASAGQRARIDELTKIVKEKDKEIERFKDFIGCKGCVDVIKKSNENQKQLAIQELEKVKEKIDCEMAIREYDISEQTADVCVSIAEQIDQQIKELKGESK